MNPWIAFIACYIYPLTMVDLLKTWGRFGCPTIDNPKYVSTRFNQKYHL